MGICPLSISDLREKESRICLQLVKKLNHFNGQHFLGLQSQKPRLSTFLSAPDTRPLNALAWFEASDPRNREQPWWVYIGAEIMNTNSATYCMAASPKTAEMGQCTQGVFRVHCDYQFEESPAIEGSTPELKPERHWQIGGRVQSELADMGFTPSWAESSDKPRIPAIPTCFVLMLHWAFLEFRHCDHVADILEKPWWDSLAREAEEEILKPYFEQCSGFFTGVRSQSYFSKVYI